MNKTICHKAEVNLSTSECELVVNENMEDKALSCCKPSNRYDCYQDNQLKDEYEDDYSFFSVVPKKAQSCRKGKTWSVRARRCIKMKGV